MGLGGCSSPRGGATTPAGADAAKDVDMGQQATLRAIGGSAVSGKIRVINRGDGATVLVSVINFPAGAYRLAFHERPNCSSPNGFSAGPAWSPPSSGKRPEDLVPPQYANSESRVESEFRIAGLRTTGPNGVAGRSVVLYSGSQIPELRPDVPNAAFACGVFDAARTPTF
jgi:Cu/Zn superoxide dismutase